MNYNQVLAYMYKQLPMYQRVGSSAFKKTLKNIIALCNALDNPHEKFKSIHVAGTNGKGSVSHMLASVLQEAGYETGLYTSPHLKDFRERIKLNGNKISKHQVISFIENNRLLFKSIQPSFFEITVAMAFNFFAKKKIDIAIIETGLGGRLDSTNIIRPELSIITNISKDHTDFLGNTLKQIAKEKAGIIKKNVSVVIGEYNKSYYSVIQKICISKKAPLHIATKKYSINEPVNTNHKFQIVKVKTKNSKSSKSFKLDLTGKYQAQNLCTVLQSLEVIKKQFPINQSQIKHGLNNVILNTGLNGRWQILKNKPLTICDTGHNTEAIKYIIKQLMSISHKELHMVMGLSNDKNTDDILRLLPQNAFYYFCKADVPRGLNQNELKKSALIHNLNGKAYTSVRIAYREAQKNASKNDLIFIGGSAFIVAEVL